jgi:formate-dependent nitrite reductase membrane component NrfD
MTSYSHLKGALFMMHDVNRDKAGALKEDANARVQQSDLTAQIVKAGNGGMVGGNGEEWTGKAKTYYGNPLLKKAHWTWEIILYFFLGGLSAGAYLVATLAHVLRVKQAESLIRSGRYISFVCILASPLLLIKDLGRPERFQHMLRVFKLRSVMSLGTWALSIFGLCNGFTAAHQAANDGLLDWFPLVARMLKAFPVKVIEIVGMLFGLFVGSYTGVLLSSTAVPVWARARHILGPLFLTSGLSTALASLSFVLSFGRRNQDMLEKLERAEIVTVATELGLLSALPSVLGPLAKPLFAGRTGKLFLGGTIAAGVILPLLARVGWKLTRRSTPRSWNRGLSLLVLLGGLILRYVWIVAGRVSADDPQATHYYNKHEWHRTHKDEP